jgi:hypothetical protein
MATQSKGKQTVSALATQLIAGTNKRLAGTTQILVAGSSYTPAQAIEKLQAIVNLRSDVDVAKASTKAKLATEKADMPALRAFMGAFVTFVKAAFSSQPDALADFGLHPKARTPLTVEQKTAAAAKRKATRAARNTMGSEQKKSVKGAVIGVTVTPITAPKPPAAVPTGPNAPATSTGTTATTAAPAPSGAAPSTGTTPHTSSPS